MSETMWFALPPEIHCSLLLNGPGPTPLDTAAQAWDSLNAEYYWAAVELEQTLATVQATCWQGSSADEYFAAHQPYLLWLRTAASNSAIASTQLRTVAAAYTAAAAAMPTMTEMALNHLVHGALLSTNFFGINTVPIALNEADYERMWIQAATTMLTYQSVAQAVLAATPSLPTPPPIVRTRTRAPDTVNIAAPQSRLAINGADSIASELLQSGDGLSGLISDVLDALFSYIQAFTQFLAASFPGLFSLIPAAATPFVGYVIFQTIGVIGWSLILSPFLLGAAIPIAVSLTTPVLESSDAVAEAPAPLHAKPVGVSHSPMTVHGPTLGSSSTAGVGLAPNPSHAANISATSEAQPGGSDEPHFYATGTPDTPPPAGPTISEADNAKTSQNVSTSSEDRSKGVAPDGLPRARRGKRSQTALIARDYAYMDSSTEGAPPDSRTAPPTTRSDSDPARRTLPTRKPRGLIRTDQLAVGLSLQRPELPMRTDVTENHKHRTKLTE